MVNKIALSGREKLADYLSKCTAAGVGGHLSPEQVAIALKELRAYANQNDPKQFKTAYLRKLPQ
jgi:hypothetical protein